MPYDGIRRQLRIFTPARIAVELKKNGFMRGKPIFYKKNELYFSIENREGKEHGTLIKIETDTYLPHVSMSASGKDISVRELSSGLYEACIPMKGETVDVKIRFR